MDLNQMSPADRQKLDQNVFRAVVQDIHKQVIGAQRVEHVLDWSSTILSVAALATSIIVFIWYRSFPLIASMAAIGCAVTATTYWRKGKNRQPISMPGWPRVWTLASFLLGKRARTRVFEPAHEELLEDYLLAKQFRTRWARAWIQFCFVLRTAGLFCGCVRALLIEAGLGWIIKAVPSRLKNWWLG